MIPALLGLIAPVAAVKVLSGLVRAAGAALRSATAPAALPVPPVVEKAAEVSEQVSDSPVIFAYDGMSRRTKITELSNGTVTSKKLYFWLGGSIVCERDGLVSGFPITKRYFGQGVLQGTTKLFYTTDHLGSVRELVDDAGTVQAQYRYSTYGERTKETGNLDSDWGYAGLWHHTPSGLDLATYRLYDAANKRWISRDPLGEGVDYNLYRYCGNDPINFVDPMGLDQVDIEPHDRPEYREHQRKRKKTIERLRCNGFDEEADLIERYQSRDPIYFWDGSWGFTSPAGPTTYIRGGLDDEMFMVTAVHEANHVKQGSSRLLKEGLRAKVLGSQDAERMQEGEVYRAEATFIEQYMNRDSSLTPAQTQTLTNRRDYANSRASSMGY